MQIIREFLKYEAFGGILLALTAIVAMIIKNSPLENFYDGFLITPVVVQIGSFIIDKPLFLWINDGLMAIFFLLVGLEIKREILEGELSSVKKFSLPAIAAVGGILLPALIYTYFNWNNAQTINGWAIPAATDIAFALGVLLLLGKRVPDTLRICLVAIAILDDLVAIVIIALFYTDSVSLYALAIAAITILMLAILNRRGVTSLTPYILIGVVLWACVLKSGVHATLAGVILAFFIPLSSSKKADASPAKELEHSLHPWVSYLVLPIFAFANAGVSLRGLSLDLLIHPITLGIAAGLFFGKQIGIMLFTAIGVGLKICQLPDGVSWRQYYGMAIITGIGFTMSLFIGALAFDDTQYQTYIRLGVLLGSVSSGVVGYLLIRTASVKKSAI